MGAITIAEVETGAGCMRVTADVAADWHARMRQVAYGVGGLPVVARMRFHDDAGCCIDGEIAGWCYLVANERTWLLPTALVGEMRVAVSLGGVA